MEGFDPSDHEIELCEIIESGTVTEAYAPLTSANPESAALRAIAEYLDEQPERVPVIAVTTAYRDVPHPMFVAVLVTGPPVDGLRREFHLDAD